MKKIYSLILLILLVAALIVACSSTPAEDPPVSSQGEEEPGEVAEVEDLVLTAEELAQYNGQDGMPAYVAVDGVIYDVTDVEYWSGGTHNGFTAGKDLTHEIKNISPHGVGRLEGVPIVGKLAE